MKQAANIHDLQLPLLLPSIKINTFPDNYAVVRSMQLERFDGQKWVRFGDILTDK